MTLPTSRALPALLAAFLLSTPSLAWASEAPPPAAAEPAPAAPNDTPRHHGCRMGSAAKGLRAFFLKPDASGQSLLARVGIVSGTTAIAAVGTTAAVGALTLAVALPACAANAQACGAILGSPVAHVGGPVVTPPAAVRTTLSPR